MYPTSQIMNRKEIDLLFLRHAYSQLNVSQKQFFKNHKTLFYPEAQSHKTLSEQILFSPKFIDSRLSPQGQQQCLRIRSNPTFDHVKLVLVSPLTRALQTAQIIFGRRRIPIIVRPELTEAFRYGCDLSGPLDGKIAQFPRFNFQAVQGFKKHWEIQNILQHKNKMILQRWLLEHPQSSFKEQQAGICGLVAERTLVQSDQELRVRVRRVKHMLKQYRKRYDKICVVSHFFILGFLLTERFDGQSAPIKMPGIDNVKPMWVSLTKLLRHI